jgi:uncharacterized phage-like protein YoqJ
MPPAAVAEGAPAIPGCNESPVVFFPEIRAHTASFTGHRTIGAREAAPLAASIRKTVEELAARGITRFCAGGAQGFDMLAALVVLETPGVSLTLILPCREQTSRWQPVDIGFYNDVLDRANEVIYTADSYSAGCYHLRNRRLVEESSILVCYFTGKAGGTAYTVDYAKKNNLEIINLAGG